MNNDTLDYNLAYYALTQDRANQLAIDQQRYTFVEFSYTNPKAKQIYRNKDNNTKLILKIEFNENNINGNVYIVRKEFYPETLYDYVTLDLNDKFLEFYLTNLSNPKYRDIDLRAVWWFLALDNNIEFSIKKVRDTKYIFSYKQLCQSFDNNVCCDKLGILKTRSKKDNKIVYLCPNHYTASLPSPTGTLPS